MTGSWRHPIFSTSVSVGGRVQHGTALETFKCFTTICYPSSHLLFFFESAWIWVDQYKTDYVLEHWSWILHWYGELLWVVVTHHKSVFHLLPHWKFWDPFSLPSYCWIGLPLETSVHCARQRLRAPFGSIDKCCIHGNQNGLLMKYVRGQ